MRLSGVAGCAAAESTGMRHQASKSGDRGNDIRDHRLTVTAVPPTYTISVPVSFSRQQGSLVCDGVALADIAAAEGTPLYVYSAGDDRGRYRADRRGVRVVSARHALRAQGQLDAGDRAAAARPRQQRRRQLRRRDRRRAARRVHPAADRVHRRRQDRAPSWRRRSISASRRSTPSRKASSNASTRSRASGRRGRASRSASTPTSTRAAIRTSRPASRPTSSASSIDDGARSAAGACATAPALEIVGLHTHVGSQITDLEPLRRAAARDRRAGARARAPTGSRSSTSISAAASASRTTASPVPTRGGVRRRRAARSSATPGLAIVLEPGRSIVGPAGALLTRVVDVKEQPGGKLFVILDAGMTELIRPMLYNAFHRIEPVETRPAPEMLCDVVGPLCESSDTLGQGPALAAAARSAISSPSSTPAPTGRSWPRTTTAARCPPK